METINLEDRKKLTVKGATKIISATSTQAIIELENINLIATGTNIEVTKLDLENKEVVFSGDFSGFKYNKKAEKTNIFKKLFK